jgi:hypothetical protein
LKKIGWTSNDSGYLGGGSDPAKVDYVTSRLLEKIAKANNDHMKRSNLKLNKIKILIFSMCFEATWDVHRIQVVTSRLLQVQKYGRKV